MPLLAITATNQKGELKVDINKNLETTPHSALDGLINKTSSALQISIAAVGKWRLYNKPTQDPAIAPFYNETDSQGYQDIDGQIFDRYQWIHPYYPAGCLISSFHAADGSQGVDKAVKLKNPGEDYDSSGTNVMAGAPYTVILPPGYYVIFGINDDHRFFPDNTGTLTIQFAVV